MVMAASDFKKMFPVSWQELHRDAKALAWRLVSGGPWNGIVAVTRGGLVPAAIVARELDVRLIDTISVASYDHMTQGSGKILKGLSPRQNREVPPLKYDYVYRLKRDFPQLEIVINGGITTRRQIESHLAHADGVMLGRAAYHDSWILADPGRTRAEVVRAMAEYARGLPALRLVARHLLGEIAKHRVERRLEAAQARVGWFGDLRRAALGRCARRERHQRIGRRRIAVDRHPVERRVCQVLGHPESTPTKEPANDPELTGIHQGEPAEGVGQQADTDDHRVLEQDVHRVLRLR